MSDDVPRVITQVSACVRTATPRPVQHNHPGDSLTRAMTIHPDTARICPWQ